MDDQDLAEPDPRGGGTGLGSRRPTQPEHSVRRGAGPGWLRVAGARPGAVLPTAARPLREDPRSAWREDPRTMVRRARSGPAPGADLRPGRTPQGHLGDPARSAGPADGVLPGPAADRHHAHPAPDPAAPARCS